MGYSAQLSKADWSKSRDASHQVLGTPTIKTIEPTALVRARFEWTSWPMGHGLNLTYSHMFGLNVRGMPYDTYSVMLEPADMEKNG